MRRRRYRKPHAAKDHIIRADRQAKIDCGREHFKALGTGVKFAVANSYNTFEQATK